MARLTGPLFSLGASGTIAKTLTFSSWKGIPYARTRVIPYNPQSDAQNQVRGVFSTLSDMWKRMPHNARIPFIYAARGLALTARNRHVQANVKALIDQTDLNNLVMSIAGGQAVQPVNVVPNVEVAKTITVTCDSPPVPPGYTLGTIFAAAVADGVPSPVLTRVTYLEFDEEAPWSISITVPAAGPYQLGVWAGYLRDADNRPFVSAAVRKQVDVIDA